ncbi:MAG: sulfite reductase subunit C [Candidatus Rifleibacteriota bacterium]
MSSDIDRGNVTKNAFRITKNRNMTAARIRIPGGHLDSKHLHLIGKIAEKFGNGNIHITTRQGVEIPGIPLERIPEVNAALTPLIENFQIKNGVEIPSSGTGYPAAGMRNISACIGSRVCPFANSDTTALAQKLEGVLYPNDLHIKVAITGCPNDCIKAHMQDFGIISICEPVLDYDACIGCEACEKVCRRKVTGAISMRNGKAVKDERRCIGCGECVLACPVAAWTRKPQQFYRMVIMGRTGKRNPRLARPFLNWANEETVIQVIKNTIPYIERHILRCLKKEHIGYIVDRTGYQTFCREVLEGVELNPEAKVARKIQWTGYNTVDDADMKAPARWMQVKI